MFAVELAVPFLVFAPDPLRTAAFVVLVGFQIVLMATGSYGFFNVLTIVLCVPLLDDATLRPVAALLEVPAPGAGNPVLAGMASAIFQLFLVINLLHVMNLVARQAWASWLLEWPERLRLTSSYGLFAVMTTRRFELEIEGSDDLVRWRAYRFRWKPGDLQEAPRQAAPHHPRLDWQMWFAALRPWGMEPWLHNLLIRLLEGSRPVLALFREDPFRGVPPRHVRLVLYRYRFARPGQRHVRGMWWERSRIEEFAPVSLEPAADDIRGGDRALECRAPIVRKIRPGLAFDRPRT